MKTILSNPRVGRQRSLFAAILLLFGLSAGTPQARASYRYEFEFGELKWEQYYYPPDEFSFLSPALIGPDSDYWPGFPYVESIMFSPPAELNGFVFDAIGFDLAFIAGDVVPANLYALSFEVERDWSMSIPDGQVGGLYMSIEFAPGTYGPGVYESDHFRRGVTHFGYSAAHSAPGVLTITYVPDAVVPAPGAILLGTLGAGLVGWLRRRTSL